ncbi:hypothetical protein [Solirubrobacter soli]|uniref:hypothetical protein n=1 Tax=Solirubrobacter soli TaxID=363832 RepID=UPI0004857DCF|nr:hypothetical protein [Solirubrobacter soli]
MSGPRSTPSGGRLALIIIGALVATASLAIFGFAGFLHWVNSKRDDGYFTTGAVRVGALNHALTSDLDVHRGLVSVIGKDGFRMVRLHVDAPRDMFVGVARTEDVNNYLRDTTYTRLTDFDLAPFRPYYAATLGDRTGLDTAPDPPGDQDIWTAKAQGSGSLTLDWKVAPGSSTLVLMNADGSTGVDAQVDAGAQIPLIGTLAWVFTVVAVVVLAVGVLMIVLGVRRRPQPSSPAGSAWGA